MSYSGEELQLLRHYEEYNIELQRCKTLEQRENLQQMWEFAFRTMETTLERVKALKGRQWESLVKNVFSACFELPIDRTAFELRHAIKIKVAEGWAELLVDDGRSFEDYPGHIHVSPYGAAITWKQWNTGRKWLQLHRDIAHGPAEVTIRFGGQYKGRHFVDGSAVNGHKNWRKRCAKHNHWIPRIRHS